MTKIINGIHVRTYEEWILILEVKEIVETLEECTVCDGEGTHECKCGDTHSCGNCLGDGKQDNLQDMYNKEVKEELQKLLIWREKVLGKQEK